jgi:hypothetical protein
MTFPPPIGARVLIPDNPEDPLTCEEATVIGHSEIAGAPFAIAECLDGVYEYLFSPDEYIEEFPVIQIYSKRDNEPELTERSFSWLQSTFGSGVRVLTPSNPTTLFRIVRIDCIEGPASVMAIVLDRDGKPISEQPVAESWPDPANPAGPDELTSYFGPVSAPIGGLKSAWSERAIVQRTGSNGDTGFGFGGGFVIHDNKGPGTLWVLSPTYPSEALTGIGWLGDSNHWGPNKVYFQIVDTVPDESTNPPTDPGLPVDSLTILALLSQIDTATSKIRALIGA